MAATQQPRGPAYAPAILRRPGAETGDERGTGGNDVRRARRGRGAPAASLALVAVVAIVSSMAGAGFAALVSEQQVHQEFGAYQAVSSTSPNFPTAPTLALAADPVASCASGSSFAYPAGSPTNYQLRIALGVSGAAACSSSDLAELVSFASPATTTAETVTVLVSTTWGPANATWSETLTLNVGASTVPSGSPNPTLQLVLDFGSASVPDVSAISVVVT